MKFFTFLPICYFLLIRIQRIHNQHNENQQEKKKHSPLSHLHVRGKSSDNRSDALEIAHDIEEWSSTLSVTDNNNYNNDSSKKRGFWR